MPNAVLSAVYSFTDSSQQHYDVGTIIKDIWQIKKPESRSNFSEVTELVGVKAGRTGGLTWQPPQ